MIPQYISELLLRFDTVILPGFGAFRLQNISAEIKGDIIIPPRKILIFDAALIHNDGVLANYISEKSRISFIDACSRILEFVEIIQKDLTAGNAVTLEKIGIVKKDNVGDINFIADKEINYNIDSFGLTSVAASPLGKTLQGNDNMKFQVSAKKRRFPVAAIYIIAAAIISAAGFATVYFINPEVFNKIGINFNPKTNDISLPSAENKSEHTSINSGDSINANDSMIKGNQTDSSNASQMQLQENVRYYVIAASFRIKENADNYVIQMNNNGNHSESIFMPEKNLYVVSYNVYTDKQQAEQALTGFRTSGNHEAWILEK